MINAIPRNPNSPTGNWLYNAKNFYPLFHENSGVKKARNWDLINDPDHNPTDNVCALRMSMAFNAIVGLEIPHIFSDDNHDGVQDSGEEDITLEGADSNGLPNGKFYFLRAEWFVRYCIEVFPDPDIIVTHQQILNGAKFLTALGQNHGLYFMLPTSNFPASGHCDFYYYSTGLGYYKTVAGNNWPYVNPLYFWILQ